MTVNCYALVPSIASRRDRKDSPPPRGGHWLPRRVGHVGLLAHAFRSAMICCRAVGEAPGRMTAISVIGKTLVAPCGDAAQGSGPVETWKVHGRGVLGRERSKAAPVGFRCFDQEAIWPLLNLFSIRVVLGGFRAVVALIDAEPSAALSRPSGRRLSYRCSFAPVRIARHPEPAESVVRYTRCGIGAAPARGLNWDFRLVAIVASSDSRP